MTEDRHFIDHIYFSEHLKSHYPKIYGELTGIQSKHKVCHNVLHGTADYWCRDYMPIQVSGNYFVQFKYHPDYLEGLRKYEISTEASIKLAIEKIQSPLIKSSPIVADGGNFTLAGIQKEGIHTPVVIMTEKIFTENPDMTRECIIKQLESLFPNHRFLFLPWDKDDTCGHTDGIIHAVGNNKILVNLKVYPNDIAAKMRSILNSCFEVIDLELSNYHDMSWAYINMIHTKDVIIIPGLGLPTDQKAQEHIQKLFPEYKDRIYQVQMPTIVKKWGGALNCLSWTFTL